MGGRRDSSAQVSGQSPPSTSPPPTNRNRRRSSLAQLTDILREWSGTGTKRNQKPPLNRRETLADLARSLPWHRISNDQYVPQGHAPPLRKRRESSCDSGIKSMRSRRDSHTSELAKIWNRKDAEKENQEIPNVSVSTEQTTVRNGSRRGSGDSNYRASRRDSTQVSGSAPPKVIGVQRKRRDSLAAPEMPNFRQEQRPSTSSADSGPLYSQQVDTACQSIPMPTIIMSSVTPPATSPKFEVAKSGRRDSTTQCNSRMNRRESRLQRQATAYDESCAPSWSRRGSQPGQQPALSPSEGGPSEVVSLCERQARRDSLSPDINTSKYVQHKWVDTWYGW